MKLWLAALPTPLLALIVTAYVPPVPAPGVPESKPELANVTPVGSEPEVALKLGEGVPVPVTLNKPALPTVNVAALPDVIAAASLTEMETVRLLADPMPFTAARVTGYVPPVPLAGVPAMLPFEVLKPRPLGRLPSRLSAGAGKPTIPGV